MIIVTGGAGFIGSNLVRGLNERGLNNILIVDDLSFIKRIEQGIEFGGPTAIYHQGACSDTMETDGRFIMETNYQYSKSLYHYCGQNSIPFIYASSASVYGGGEVFKEIPENESILNAYAYSKLQFDRYVRKNPSVSSSQVVGLRYFNVYGERENHKGRMASVAYHFFHQYHKQGYVNLFEGSAGYANGANKTTAEWASEGKLKYIPFPEALVGKYQSYTKADLTNLTISGDYNKTFATVEEGVSAYVGQLQSAHA